MTLFVLLATFARADVAPDPGGDCGCGHGGSAPAALVLAALALARRR